MLVVAAFAVACAPPGEPSAPGSCYNGKDLSNVDFPLFAPDIRLTGPWNTLSNALAYLSYDASDRCEGEGIPFTLVLADSAQEAIAVCESLSDIYDKADQVDYWSTPALPSDTLYTCGTVVAGG